MPGLMIAGTTLITSCNTSGNLEKPNIVWITSEDNSKHFMELFDEHGAPTPNIEKLANRGVVFSHAFSNAPVCSVARSTLISGCYAPRIGAQFHRKYNKVPMPENLKMFPAYLREKGYYTTNNAKEDYNIIKTEGVWDESSNKASWRNRENGQPFFHVQNIGITHESSLHFDRKEMENTTPVTDPEQVFVPPIHPDTELFRYTYATYHDKIMKMDERVGEVLDRLEEDGLLDETIVFYFGDHGGVLPGSKGYLYETGLHVPLVVYVPEKYEKLVGVKQGSTVSDFVSFVDFGATVLNLAGVEVPEEMDGQAFLGKGTRPGKQKREQLTFSYADRFDEKYDLVRSVRAGDYKYIRNYQPYNIDALQNNYRYRMLAYVEWREMYHKDQLREEQARFFEKKPAEALYNVAEDPYELNNLAGDPDYTTIKNELGETLVEQITSMPDLSFYPESYLAEHALKDPVSFGKERKEEISELVAVADLALLSFEEAEEELLTALDSENEWKRYWALTACSSFDESSVELIHKINEISKNDQASLNRLRALEYLALGEHSDSGDQIVNEIKQSKDPVETLIMLNTLALLKDIGSPYVVSVSDSLFQEVDTWNEIKSRLKYLGN